MILTASIFEPGKDPRTVTFDGQESGDPVGASVQNILTNPHIRKPVRLMAIFDDGEIIVWAIAREGEECR